MNQTNEQIQVLKAAAELIAHGYQQEWGVEGNCDSVYVGTYDRDDVFCPFINVSISDWSDEDGDDTRLADFIAKANPPAILSLLAEREADKALISSLSTLICKQADRIAELEARTLTVKLPDELYAIAENLRTQDNRCTDQPMFAVMQKREIIGSDDHSPSRIVWCWDGEEVSELRASRLEALHQGCRDTRGYDRYAMQEIDEFVTACFTEQGCRDYLERDGHNLRLPFIYAFGSFRNSEYQFVRKWLAGITLVVGGE